METSPSPAAPDVGAMHRPCVRLIGASFWGRESSPLDHLIGIRARLLHAAQTRGVRIALLLRARWLIHWFEGPASAVDSAWQRVLHIPELRGTRELHRSWGTSTLHDRVHVAALSRPESAAHAARDLFSLQAQGRSGATLAPVDMWTEIVAPGFGSHRRGNCVAAIVSARANDAVELLHALAQRERRPLTYHRFAGADLRRGEKGAAYAELGPARVKVMAMSRACVDEALVALMLRDARALLLMSAPGMPPSAALAHIREVATLDPSIAMHDRVAQAQQFLFHPQLHPTSH